MSETVSSKGPVPRSHLITCILGDLITSGQFTPLGYVSTCISSDSFWSDLTSLLYMQQYTDFKTLSRVVWYWQINSVQLCLGGLSSAYFSANLLVCLQGDRLREIGDGFDERGVSNRWLSLPPPSMRRISSIATSCCGSALSMSNRHRYRQRHTDTQSVNVARDAFVYTLRKECGPDTSEWCIHTSTYGCPLMIG